MRGKSGTKKTSLCLMVGVALGILLTLAGCGAGGEGSGETGQEPASRDFFAMDTYMTVTAYGDGAEAAVVAAEEEVNRLDAMLSTGDPDSEVSRLNSKGRLVLSGEAGALVERGLDLYRETGHRFDIAIYPIMEAWGFTDKAYRVPSEEEIEDLLPLTDAARVKCQPAPAGDGSVHDGAEGGGPVEEAGGSGDKDGGPAEEAGGGTDKNDGAGEEGLEVSFGEKGMGIDLGGIAKGYASSRIMDIYRQEGVTSGMVSLGGNVQVLGTKPDGTDWRVAIQDPASGESDGATADPGMSAAADGADVDDAAADGENDPEAEAYEEDAGVGTDPTAQYLGVLEAADTAVVTSGPYERYFTQSGVRYHHIIDPATGMPAESGLQSVTIVSPDGTLADALSTSLFIMGKEEALDYWRANADRFDCILMDDEGTLYVTKPIADRFSSETYPVKVVE